MSQSFQFRVASEEGGQRLDAVLASRLGNLSRIRIANLLAAKACLVDQRPRHAGYHVETGQTVEITLDETLPTTAMMPEPLPLDILYEDEQILVVNKPSGMLVHPNAKTKSGTLANALAYHLNGEGVAPAASIQSAAVIRPGLVHRLDRGTSGLLVVAKTQRALSILTRHFHHRLVKKLYTAIVWGVVDEEAGVVDAPIGINPLKSPPRWVFADGKPAETRFRVTRRTSAATVLDLEPITGRTNQLRIHCAYIGHPIIGDEVYGQVIGDRWSVISETSGQNSPLSQPATDHRPLTTDHRLCLHASQLAFHHPDGGRWMEFQSPLPADLQALYRLLTEA